VFAPTSEGTAGIRQSPAACAVHFLAMFARQGCDRCFTSSCAAVAKLKCADDTVAKLLIRRIDEHATDRGRGSQ
jgi:hypothetical protein